MHLQEDTVLTLTLGQRSHKIFSQCPLYHVTYATANFEVETSKGLEEDAFTRKAGPRSAVGNASGYRCVSDCISRGREFDPGPVPYFRGD